MSDSIEDTEHVPFFDFKRTDHLAEVVELLQPSAQITNFSNDALTQLLFYGDHDLSNDLKSNILKLTIRLIHKCHISIEYHASTKSFKVKLLVCLETLSHIRCQIMLSAKTQKGFASGLSSELLQPLPRIQRQTFSSAVFIVFIFFSLV